jgi:hypothetical protein
MFCRSLFVLLSFFFWPCIICPSIYEFLLPLGLGYQCLSPLTLWVWTLLRGEVYSIQHYGIKFVSDLWQVSDFLRGSVSKSKYFVNAIQIRSRVTSTSLSVLLFLKIEMFFLNKPFIHFWLGSNILPFSCFYTSYLTLTLMSWLML